MEAFRVQLWNRTNRIRSMMFHIADPYLHSIGLTPVQAMVLYAIMQEETPTVGLLCQRLDCAQGNMSNLCKRLESDGFISRKRSTQDERVVCLELTKDGINAVNFINNGLHYADKYASSQPPERLKKILDGFDELEKLIDNIYHTSKE